MKKSRRTILVISGLVMVAGLVILGSVASVLAYRQFGRSEGRALTELSPSLLDGLQQDEANDSQLPISEKGVVIVNVDPDSPAAAAGLRRGSIILEVNGEEVNTPFELQQAIENYEAGDVIRLTVLSGEERLEVDATLASAGPYLGVGVANGAGRGRDNRLHLFTPEGQEFRFDGDKFVMPFGEEQFVFPPGEGFPEQMPGIPHSIQVPAVVTSVVPESPAQEAGLLVGDVILEVNQEPVGDRADLISLIAQLAPGDQIELTVQRGAESLSVQLTLEAHPDDAARGFMGVELGNSGLDERFFEEFFPEEQG